MKKKGHEFLITARDKEMTQYLLDFYKIPYINRGKIKKSLFSKATSLLSINSKILKIAKKFDPDLMIGVHNPYMAEVGWFLRKPVLTFTDSEPVPIANILTFPFSNHILTPDIFRLDLGKNQIRYEGYHEIAYLHPKWFKPDPSILDDLEIKKDESFIIFRFIGWAASHDVGHQGFTIEDKRKLIKSMTKFGKVFITSEKPLEKEFEEYRIKIPPEQIHSALYYASLLIGDTQTMSTEAAVVGTPVIRCNSFVGPDDMANFIELEEKYELIFNFNINELNRAIKKSNELIKVKGLKTKWQLKRNKLINDKIDVTAYLIWFVENYPDSIKISKNNLKFQNKFRSKND
jgi:predicted glycosyltransferase